MVGERGLYLSQMLGSRSGCIAGSLGDVGDSGLAWCFELAVGEYIPDLIAPLASLDIVLGEVDVSALDSGG